MTPPISYSREAVIHLPVLTQAEAHLMHTALAEKTEDALLIFGNPVYDAQAGWRTWVLSAIPTVRTATRTTVLSKEESFQAAAQHLRSPAGQGQTLCGWWHSQPGMGVYPSGTDINSYATYFNRTWQLMIISDPLRRETAVYAWRSPTDHHAVAYRIFTDDPARYLSRTSLPHTGEQSLGTSQPSPAAHKRTLLRRVTTPEGEFTYVPESR